MAYCFDLSAVKENAIISVENALVSHGEVVPGQLTIRADNGSQYSTRPRRFGNQIDVGTGTEA